MDLAKVALVPRLVLAGARPEVQQEERGALVAPLEPTDLSFAEAFVAFFFNEVQAKKKLPPSRGARLFVRSWRCWRLYLFTEA